jgi:hypothetical protein
MLILKSARITVKIDILGVSERRPALFDGITQNLVQSHMYPSRLRWPHISGGTLGMHPRPMQYFVAIDVADAGDEMLVEKSRFDRSARRPQYLAQFRQGQPINDGVFAQIDQLGHNLGRLGGVIDHDFTKSSRVNET